MKLTTISQPGKQSQPIRYLKGIGPARAQTFLKLGISTIEELFYFYPRRYEDRSHFSTLKDLRPGSVVTVRGEVLTLNLKRIPRMPIFEMAFGDNTGFIHAVWFNQAYLKRQFKVGDQLILSGKVDWANKRLQLANPEYERLTGTEEDMIHTGRIVPIYPLTEGLGQRSLRRAMKQLLDEHLHEIEEPIPEFLLTKLSLMPRREAFRNIHFPESFELQVKARERLVFEEFFIFELALIRKIQYDRRKMRSPAMELGNETLTQIENSLPFRLTESQRRVCREISKDLSTEIPMRRLLQGEVGSGKTVIAAFALLLAASNNLQGALMAPTEVLAEQHYETLSRFLNPFGLKVALLTGSLRENERSELLADLRNHRIHIAVGTHALIQEGVRFANLGLVVIDEQHKFGVRQRARLLASERKPHLLVMTATPIPRTLGLTLYGDLDISTLKELPAGRKPVKTFWISKDKEKEILRHVRERALAGAQAYIIFPLIDETEKADLLAATKEYERLCQNDFAEISVGLVHGRMVKNDRDRVMKSFRENTVKILVATSVIEVGIDNPNATTLVVEHAERFGLSQLHQLRGRIGRGEAESFCFLFGEPTTDEGKRRLRILTKIQDGFAIAEEDLKLRGPGDFLGTRQSGNPFFRLADLLVDAEALLLARREASHLLEKDPSLQSHPLLHYFVQQESVSLASQEDSPTESPKKPDRKEK